MFIIPMEPATLGTVCDECIERCHHCTKIADIHMIEIEEPKESVNFSKRHGSFPVSDTIDFDWVHSNAILANNYPKIFDFCGFELAFLQFEVEVVVS